MKIYNIIFLFLAIAMFQACNPLEDELEIINAEPQPVVADLELTLTSDDYDIVDKSFGNFNDEEEAKELIPTILTENYPQLGDGSSALVHYDIYNPVRIGEEVAFELTEDDYVALDQGFGTLSRDGHIYDAVEYKYPSPSANDVVTLTYEWFCGGCAEEGTRTSKVAYYDGRWYIAYVPTDDDYTFMGQRFTNFDSRSTGRERIGKLLDTRHLFDDEGTIRTTVFTYTYVNDDGDRQFEDFLAAYSFDGNNWIPFDDVVSRTLQLGHDGNTWVPDNTIKYSLTADDYAAIADATMDSNPSGSNSIAQFGNFDVGALWSPDQILEAIGNHLLDIFPQVEGQKYLVSYDTWEPGAGVRELHVIFQGGTYVLVE